MFVSVTTSQVPEEQIQNVEGFLQEFLPRMRQFPGVIAIYHFVRPDKGNESTVVIWESEEALRAYRESRLVKEAIAFEMELGLPSTREAYPLIHAL